MCHYSYISVNGPSMEHKSAAIAFWGVDSM